jgi:hypothetical protein
MAEKSTKKKKGKGEANVLASLPSTRPNRLGRHNRGGAATTEKAAAGTRAQPTAAKAASAATKAKATKAKPAKAKPKAKPAPVATIAEAVPNRPKPVRPASANLKEPAEKSADKRAPAPAEKPPTGTDLVSTVVQAAGELASVGLSIGGQIVKRAVDRLPKP